MHNALILHYEPRTEANGKIVSVEADALTAQLALIRKLKIPVVSLDELVENDYKRKCWHRHVALLTFTDTFFTQNPTVFQVLKTAGFPVTVFVSTDGEVTPAQRKNWQEMVQAGFSLGLHSVFQQNNPETEMQKQVENAKQILEAETDKPVRFLLLPISGQEKNVVAAAHNAHFDAVLTHKIGYNNFNADLLHLKSWPVPPHVSLKAFEHMLMREKRELLAQEMKALPNGSKFWSKSPFRKLKSLFR